MTVQDWRARYEVLSAETDRLRTRLAAVEAERDAARAGEARAVEALKAKPTVTGETSDGYHTFNELYEHRISLWVALCRVIEQQREGTVWKTQLHSDGTSLDGWFVLGMHHLPSQQITYHLPMSRWDECKFKTLDRALEFDGHTGADVLARLERMND